MVTRLGVLPCHGGVSVRHIAAFGNAVLEITPLRLCIGSIFTTRWLRRVGLDRQRATLLRKLRADWTGGLRAIRRRGFSQQGRCGKKQHDERDIAQAACSSAEMRV